MPWPSKSARLAGWIYLSIYPSIYLSIYLFIYLSTYLPGEEYAESPVSPKSAMCT